ncbi:MAG: hypothetical protein JWR90_1432 [Marmoricola sp.]|nr:hypothetical protein [Marmoricola sp.]
MKASGAVAHSVEPTAKETSRQSPEQGQSGGRRLRDVVGVRH